MALFTRILQLCIYVQLQYQINGGSCTRSNWAVIKPKPFCQPPWLAYKNNCYLCVRVKRNFAQAEAHCQSYSKPGRPSHLASVIDDNENQFIFAYGSGCQRERYWLGLNNLPSGAAFSWTDGSTHDFESWEPDEPEGQNGRPNIHCTEPVTDKILHFN